MLKQRLLQALLARQNGAMSQAGAIGGGMAAGPEMPTKGMFPGAAGTIAGMIGGLNEDKMGVQGGPARMFAPGGKWGPKPQVPEQGSYDGGFNVPPQKTMPNMQEQGGIPKDIPTQRTRPNFGAMNNGFAKPREY